MEHWQAVVWSKRIRFRGSTSVFNFTDICCASYVCFRNLVGRIDKNGDGKLDKSELVAWIASVEERHYNMEADEIFDKEDIDGDGFISFEEYWLNNESEGRGGEIEREGEERRGGEREKSVGMQEGEGF